MSRVPNKVLERKAGKFNNKKLSEIKFLALLKKKENVITSSFAFPQSKFQSFENRTNIKQIIYKPFIRQFAWSK